MTTTSARTTRALSALCCAIVLILAVSACGSDDAAAPTSATKHSDADVTFASDMLRHHAQALSMVDLTLGRPLDPEVQQLVESIRAAQSPQIETFADWLTEWGEEVPETMRDHTNAGHDPGDLADSMDGMDTDLPGMMTLEEMTALEDASDADFQGLWLGLMIEHHAGAVEMAQTEQEEGRYQPAVDLAGVIVDTQSAEIDTMSALRG
ncbi:DUF305 domain-containing protein [soil metagenome]